MATPFPPRPLCLALSLTLTACSRAPAPPSPPPSAPSAARPAHRIVSLAPATTETLFAVGCGDRVVGVSRFDDTPPEVRALPRVGGMVDPAFEAIVALRPDAVVGTRGPIDRAVVARLEGLRIRTHFPAVETLDELDASLASLGALCGHEADARAVRERIHARIDALHAAVAPLPRRTVLALFGQRPLVAAGPGSFTDALLALAGARNALATGPHWPTISLETVIAASPDVILDVTFMDGAAPLADQWATSLSAVPAVRDHRVVRIDDPVVTRPGPRVADALLVLARAIHPEAAFPP